MLLLATDLTACYRTSCRHRRNHQRLQRGTGSSQHDRLGHYLGDAASEMMSFKEIYLFIGASRYRAILGVIAEQAADV